MSSECAGHLFEDTLINRCVALRRFRLEVTFKMPARGFVTATLLLLLLVVARGFHFNVKSQIGRGVLLPHEMAKRGSGSGGAMPTPQADNIQSWGKFASLFFSRMGTLAARLLECPMKRISSSITTSR